MAVISITITQSEEEIVAGIPKTVSLSANIPSTIFYTLDGTDPTIDSTIYTSKIFLPTNLLSLTFKVFATNGSDTSPIITEVFETNMLEDNIRLPHSGSTAQTSTSNFPLYPFGTNPREPNGQYVNNAGIVVDDPNLTQIPDGYDGTGTDTFNSFTNLPFNVENYEVQYSTTNAIGQKGRGIGTLPANVSFEIPSAPPEESDVWEATFDPRAKVIFQDASLENPDDPPFLNRAYYSSKDAEKSSDGNDFFQSGLETPTTTGSLIRQHYNPRTNEWTFYYRDSSSNQWIISKQQHVPVSGGWDGNLSQIWNGRGQGVGRVYEWVPWQRRVLF